MTRDANANPEFLAEIFRDAPVGLCWLDTKLRFVYINEWLAAINGFSVEQHLGRTIGEVLPDVAAGIEPQLLQVIETGRSITQGTVSGATTAHPKVQRHFQHNYRAVKSDDGNVVGVSCAVLEVTQRKRAEDALRCEQDLLKHLFKIQEGERRLTSYEIHDGIIQYATGALMHAQAFVAKHESVIDLKGIHVVCEQLRKIVEEGRRLMNGLRPMVLDEFGLVPAIEHMISEQPESAPRIIFEDRSQFDRLSSAVESTIFRIVQEALTNANKYSKAETVKIVLSHSHDQIRVEVQDSGTGFDPKKVSEGRHGLSGMRERTSLLGGTLKIDSTPENGTRITADVPILVGR